MKWVEQYWHYMWLSPQLQHSQVHVQEKQDYRWPAFTPNEHYYYNDTNILLYIRLFLLARKWGKYLSSHHLVANFSVYHISIVNNRSTLGKILNLHITWRNKKEVSWICRSILIYKLLNDLINKLNSKNSHTVYEIVQLYLSPGCENKDTTAQQISCNSVHKFPRTHVAYKLFLPLSNRIEPANL